ncbi:MAG: hypothetical protein C4532_09260 [Candidatus Abyssobacteria bacterium SURF_17]|uniref:Uncharacterized protein n=1 Tax=Candidatus Abyssobacteria bacterium SURF_17 TaxID=2093361 RepID=A0A419EYS1_9BACT|nr:MAG: hypothetical protein C4532_09260 [Candidatus Abyssubacteria bacterium SURF_17]
MTRHPWDKTVFRVRASSPVGCSFRNALHAIADKCQNGGLVQEPLMKRVVGSHFTLRVTMYNQLTKRS